MPNPRAVLSRDLWPRRHVRRAPSPDPDRVLPGALFKRIAAVRVRGVLPVSARSAGLAAGTVLPGTLRSPAPGMPFPSVPELAVPSGPAIGSGGVVGQMVGKGDSPVPATGSGAARGEEQGTEPVGMRLGGMGSAALSGPTELP